MIARGFKSVIWVATVGGAALACYMVSLQVATERSELDKVERQIIAAKQDIRSLQTELGTRGRLSQLEHWNAEVLALSAPTTAQFLPSAFTLARLERRDTNVAEETAAVRLASAETGAAAAPAKAPAAPRVVQAVAPAAQAGQAATVHRASLDTASSQLQAAAPQAKVEARARATAKAEKAAVEQRPPAKSQRPATATAAAKPRLGGKLAAELGAAARVEKDKGSGGN